MRAAQRARGELRRGRTCHAEQRAGQKSHRETSRPPAISSHRGLHV
jgi:hypothetical protein